VSGPVRQPATGAATPGRHRAPRRSGVRGRLAGPWWSPAALAVVGLVGARYLRSTPLPDDGTLTVPAATLLRGAAGPAPLSPEWLAAVHTAGYAALTRAFQRHATLVGAERELLLVLLVVTAVLLWRTARRLDLPDPACAAALLVLGAVALVGPLPAAAGPAALALPWALAAAWAATGARTPGRRPVAVVVPTVSAAVPAVLLAPDVLLLLVAGAAVAATARARSGGRRVGAALLGAVLAAGVRLLLEQWDPQPADPGRWGGSWAGAVLLVAALTLVGVLAAWRLPGHRAAGTALAATTLLAVVPPSGRLPALLLCTVLAALLVGALAAAVAERHVLPVLSRRPRGLLAAGLAGAVLLAGAGTAAVAGPAGGLRSDFGAADHDRLVAWMAGQLPEQALLTAPARVAAELVHTGAAPARLRTGAEPPPPAGSDAALAVVTGGAPVGSDVVARFGGLTVVDQQPVRPTAEQVRARAELAAALLANPTTEVSSADAGILAAGQVDPRLLGLLAGIAARYGLGLDGLPAVPGEPRGALARQAVVSAVGGRLLSESPAAARELRTWLAVQQEPYAPDRITDVDGGLLLGYDLVADPDGLVTGPGRG
jgi:hypothetical protein